MYRRTLTVDEDYDLVFDQSEAVAELDPACFDPNELWVATRVQQEVTAHYGIGAESAIANVRLVVRRAVDAGSYRRTAQGTFLFWWRGFYVTVSPDLQTAKRYRTVHYERTPIQVNDGVKSRLSKKQRARRDPVPVPESLSLGQLHDGIVVNVVSFGAFVEIADGFEALLHKSELGGLDPESIGGLNAGDRVRVEILSIDSEAQRVSLRLVRPHPLDESA